MGNYSKIAEARKARRVEAVIVEKLNNNDADLQWVWIVMVWCLVGMSGVLFLWDIIQAVSSVLDLWLVHYHGFVLDKGFHLWLFFEEYYPHSGWQLCLWLVAAQVVKFNLSIWSELVLGVQETAAKKFQKAKGVKQIWHPGMKTAFRVFVYEIMVITIFDGVIWLGNCYWRKIGEGKMRDSVSATETVDSINWCSTGEDETGDRLMRNRQAVCTNNSMGLSQRSAGSGLMPRIIEQKGGV